MKKQIIYSLSILMLFAVVFTNTGCGKYPDGPSMTVLTKKMRLTGDWTIEKVLYNNQDQTAAYNSILGNYIFSIKKDGTYTVSGNFTDNGTWDLSSDKMNFLTTSAQSNSTQQSTPIDKLKNKEFWTKETDSNGNITEIHYKQ